MFTPKKILVPTDFSEFEDQCSILAVNHAAEIARKFDSTIILLHVVTDEVSKMPLYFLDDDKLDNLKDKMCENAEHELHRIRDKFIPDQDVKVILKVREGAAYDEILKEEREAKVDLIVISSRGHSRLVDFFYGSTTEKVARGATCSVLVARNNKKKKAKS